MRHVIIVVCVVAGLATTALAKGKLDAARAHYKAGAAYYQRGKYVDAIREFQASYELSRKPEILYNLAQCHDKLGQRAKVAEYLRRYLAGKPNADDREQVEAWLSHLDKAVAAERAAAEKAAAEKAAAEKRAAAEKAAAEKAAAEKAAAEKRAAEANAAAEKAGAEKAAAEKRAAEARAAAERAAAEKAAAAKVAATTRPAADLRARRRAWQAAEDTGWGWRLTGDLAIGVGIVTVLVSAIPGVIAYSKARNLEDKLDTGKNPGATFDPDLQSDYRSGPGNSKAFIGLISVGSALIVAGAISLVYGKKLRSRARERLVLAPAGTGGTLAWRF
jgi:tetratricopeptide (TPR) repeat protein